MKQIKWLNCAKFFAIMCVMTDHTINILYTNMRIWRTSNLGVPIFILIAGITGYWSHEKRDLPWLKDFARYSKKIFAAYVIANIYYEIFFDRMFDLSIFVKNIPSFMYQAHFWYVMIYIQLMAVSKPLYGLIKRLPEKGQIFWEIGIALLLLKAGECFERYTNILDIWSGGGKFLGGSYLMMFYLGMLLAKHKIFEKVTVKKSALVAVSGAALWVIWSELYYRYPVEIDNFGTGLIPSFGLRIFTYITLFLLYGIFTLAEQFKGTKWIVTVTDYIGRHTLYIFLYHIYVLYHGAMLSNFLLEVFCTESIHAKRILYFAAMIVVPIFLEYVINAALNLLGGKVDYSKLAEKWKKKIDDVVSE